MAEFVAGNPAEDIRLFQAVADALHWCEALFSSAQLGHDFLRRCHTGLGLAYENTGNRRGHFFREQRARLDAHVAAAAPVPAVAQRLGALAAAVRAEGGEDPARLFPVAGSALRLHCNRLFSVDARRLEFVAYDLAGRKLRERQARSIPQQPAAIERSV